MQYQVTVSLITYNHFPYIETTLKSILAQKTNFNFKVVVHDDASTDGTQEIIKAYQKKYPDIIFPILQTENQYSKGALISRFTYPKMEGKYIAFCEGDDYWASEEKLQTQYDFLEMHSDFSGVCGCSDYVDDQGHLTKYKIIPSKKYRGKEITQEQFYRGANFGTNTLMVRAEMLNEDFLRIKEESKKVGDILLIAQTFSYGKIFVVDKLFEHHRIQLRDNASNYNSIYSVAEKFKYQDEAILTVLKNYPVQVAAKYAIQNNVGFYFWRLLFKGQLKEFYDVYNSIEKKYRPNLLLTIVSALPLFIKKGLAKALTLLTSR